MTDPFNPSGYQSSQYLSVQGFLSTSMCSGSLSTLSSDVIQHALNVAADEIDSALRTHNVLPLSEVPNEVLEAQAVLTTYRLLTVYGLNPGGAKSFIEQRYKEIKGDPVNPASGWLGMVAYGRKLFGNVNVSAPVPPTGSPNFPVVFASSADRHWYQGGRRNTVF